MLQPTRDFSPDPVDVHVGRRIRLLRRTRGASQETLAVILGLTCQQIQKYESGSNRVSASKLYAIARALRVPVNAFFDGLAEDGDDGVDDPRPASAVEEFLACSDALDLVAAFNSLGSGRVRRGFLDLIRLLAAEAPASATSVGGVANL